jgi:hypothetical protein
MDRNELKQRNNEIVRLFPLVLLILLLIQIAVTALLLTNDNLSFKIIDSKNLHKFYYIQNTWSNVEDRHNRFIRSSMGKINKTILPLRDVSKEEWMVIKKKLIETEEQVDSMNKKLNALNVDIHKLNILGNNSKTDKFFSDLAKQYLDFYNSIYHIDPIYGGPGLYAKHGAEMETLIRNFPKSSKLKWTAFRKPRINKFKKLLLIETAIVVFQLY